LGLLHREVDVLAIEGIAIRDRGVDHVAAGGLGRRFGEPLAQVAALGVGRGELESQREGVLRFCGASERAEEIGAGGGDQVVVSKLTAALDFVDEIEPRLRAVRHRDGHTALSARPRVSPHVIPESAVIVRAGPHPAGSARIHLMRCALRELRDGDLAVLFEQWADPVAAHMAAFTAPDHMDRGAFERRWSRSPSW
jgi:hypothetical protein